jgi:hypothetical protein
MATRILLLNIAIFGWQILLIHDYLFSTKEMLTFYLKAITIHKEEL